MASSSVRGLLLASLLLSCLIHACYGTILFSSLQKTLQVTTNTRQGVLKAGEDKVTVTWGINQTLPSGTDSAYKTVRVKLCYSPVSQKDRAWRKTVDQIDRDKTCQFKIVERPYAKMGLTTFEWTVEREVPTSTYFVRAYALNTDGHEVAYGQSTNAQKTTNLFEIQAISGRHATLDIASVCFSAFAVVSLFGFFYAEKRKGRRSQQK